MKQGKYIGPIKHLKGKVATINQLYPGSDQNIIKIKEGIVEVQFDDRTLRRTTETKFYWAKVKNIPRDALAYGWHEFNQSDFEFLN